MKLSFNASILLFSLLSSTASQAFTLTSLHSFAVAPKGAQPRCALLLAGSNLLYGTTEFGGTNGVGTVFTINTNASLRVLYHFAGPTDGGEPTAGVISDGNGAFYGVTSSSGIYGHGTIFKIDTNGNLSVVYSFGAVTNSQGTALDGAEPEGELIRATDGYFYGTTASGGDADQGTVFRLNTNGTLTTLYSFATSDGAAPVAGLVQGFDGSLYGTTSAGGANGDGTVFQITTNGTLATLYSFTSAVDGSSPDAPLVQGSDGNLYGTTSFGNPTPSGYGTVFQITTNGVLSTLHSFAGATADGDEPETGLIFGSDGNLYGTTSYGGTADAGTVFKISTAGSLSLVAQFSGKNGSQPTGKLTQTADGTLYGTTQYGGTNEAGVIFQISTAGALAPLYSFPQIDDGQNPSADLVLAKDGNFYGTTEAGGDFGDGTIFKMSPNGNLTLLYTFGTLSNSLGDPVDGAGAEGTLIQGQDGSLYGTCPSGGTSGYGSVFQITTNGAFNLLYSFNSSDGDTPWAGLVQTADGLMYGTTSGGGGGSDGTLFRISTNGDLATIYSFSGSDGQSPYAGLTVGADGLLYGTTSAGGGSSSGTIFKCDTNGALTTLYSFTGGADGGDPEAVLFLGKNGLLYGTTFSGGLNDNGTIFQIDTNGNIATLYTFSGGAGGSSPLAGVVQTSDGSLYGTTTVGGNGDNGGVFQLTTNGVFTFLPLDGITGSYPDSGVTMGPEGNLYTLSENGGTGGYGNIFRVNIISTPPVITRITKSGNTVLLNWSAIATRNYQLQFKTNLTQPSWSNIGLPITATSNLVQTNDTPGTDLRRFYRAVLLP